MNVGEKYGMQGPSTQDLPIRSELTIPGVFALLTVLVHLPFLGCYDHHHDELHVLVCGMRLACGYVDHPPLVPLMARVVDTFSGRSLLGLRVLPVAAGAAAVLLTGILVSRFGGRSSAQLTACLAMTFTPVLLQVAGILCIPAFEPLFWLICVHSLVLIIQRDDSRWWLWLGLATGIGIMNEHSMLFFCVGLVPALLFTPLRTHLKSVWFYVGGVVALSVCLPNTIWQATNSWPTVTFLLGKDATARGSTESLGFVIAQMFFLNPLAIPIWCMGLVFFFTKSGKSYRACGWICAVVLVVPMLLGVRVPCVVLAFPTLLAGGSVLLESFCERQKIGWIQTVTVSTLAVSGVLLAPLSLPLMSVEATERYIRTISLHAVEDAAPFVHHRGGAIGWRERTTAVAAVYNDLPEPERGLAVIYTSSYELASALSYLGGEDGLQGVTSGERTYYLWGLPSHNIDTVIAAHVTADDLDLLREAFGRVQVVHTVDLPPSRGDSGEHETFRVFLCREAKKDFHLLWPRTRKW
jgi:hypothetical protein